MNALIFLAGAVVGVIVMTATTVWYLWKNRPNW